jgi:transcription elongation factor Elf1
MTGGAVCLDESIVKQCPKCKFETAYSGVEILGGRGLIVCPECHEVFWLDTETTKEELSEYKRLYQSVMQDKLREHPKEREP